MNIFLYFLVFAESVKLLKAGSDCSDVTEEVGLELKLGLTEPRTGAHPPEVEFRLWRMDTNVSDRVNEESSLARRNFNIERRTVLIVDGWFYREDNTYFNILKTGLLLWDARVNIISVTWKWEGIPFNYYDAATKADIIGDKIARFLKHVVDEMIHEKSPHKPHWGALHLIGMGIGSHICGEAARKFQMLQNNWKVDRITALDPAKQCFDGVNSQHRLRRSDAIFVDVIHTSALTHTSLGFGLASPIGYIDFYVNGGITQPRCSFWNREPIDKATCSHVSAYAYFISSLIEASKTDGCKLWARRWNEFDPCNTGNCPMMGILARGNPQRGSFFVTTLDVAPYCSN